MSDRKRKKTGNKEKIKNYLLTGKSLTRVQASQLQFGMDLSTRISELRADGVPISDKYIDGKKLQKRYWMSQKNINDYNQSTNDKESKEI